MLWLIWVKAIIALGFIIHEQGHAALAEHQHLLLNHPWVHLHRQIVGMCMCVCVCTHTQHTHKDWKCTWAKWLQMLILCVRKIMNLDSVELPLGDTNVFWLLLFFFLQVLLPSEKIGSWWGVNMLIVNSIAHKEELRDMLEAVCVPGMAQIKLIPFTAKNPTSPHFSSSWVPNVFN